jgi:flagellar motor protein MotB
LKKFISAMSLFFFLCPALFAGADLSGTTSSNFEKITPFAGPAGMGEAYTSLSEGTSGLYYNPAGIAAATCFEAQFSHINWFQSINYEYLAFVAPSPVFDNAKIGLALAMFLPGGIIKTNSLISFDPSYLDGYSAASQFNDKFYPYDLSVILGYGIDISPSFSVGIRLKYISQNINSYSGSNETADIGLLYKYDLEGNNLGFGVDLENLEWSRISLYTESFDSPIICNAGISDSIKLLSGTFLAAAQVKIPSDYDNEYSAGIEYWFYDVFALRFGYEAGAYNQPTFGAGVKYRGLEINYAYVNYTDLGSTQRLSLLYTWGTPHSRLNVEPPVFSPNGDKILDLAYFYPVLDSREKIKSLMLNIYKQDGKILVSRLPVADKTVKILPWDGKVDGKPLPDGIYTASITAEYENGSSESNLVKIEIDTTPPLMSINAGPSIQVPGGQDSAVLPVIFELQAQDRNMVYGWQLVIWGADKKIFFMTSGRGAPPPEYVWDGADMDGNPRPEDSIYYYSLISTDSVGNRGMTRPVSITALTKEIKLEFASDALFDLGKADVKISAYSVLKTIKDAMDRYPGSFVKVSGYTDNIQPQGIKYSDNTELSKDRADAIKFFMINLLGYDGKNISAVGYGELCPVANNDTEEGRKKNRRVEITLYR